MTDLRNKVALATGSARGIGKAIAERYASLAQVSRSTISKDEKRATETIAARVALARSQSFDTPTQLQQ
jgi:3-oxoacyl-[acyl-carrier protein] reductase